jgi:hypothetical protein
MLINIPDDITPEERKDLLENAPIIYVLTVNYFNKTKSARWLGLSLRSLQIKMGKSKVLRHFFDSSIKNRNEKIKEVDPALVEEAKGLWQTKRKMLIDEFKKTLTHHQMTPEQRQAVINNINKTY